MPRDMRSIVMRTKSMIPIEAVEASSIHGFHH